MIGDWFRFRYTIDGKEIVHTFRISRIEDELGDYYVWGEGFGRMCYPKRLEPIPITPEILEKNGFRNIGGHWYDYAADYYELEVEAYCDSIWRVFYHSTEFNIGDERVFVSHIHELQHALRLFGIKREIEL